MSGIWLCMKTAIYPGSFDPITSGHLNIIRRASSIFDKLIVCVMINAGKNPMFTQKERVELIRRVTGDLPNVEVDSSNELLAEYARRRGSCVVVKGLRAVSDFETEFQMVKELGTYGVDLSDLLPGEIIPDFQERIENRKKSI